ncbi:MAG: glycosyltransferase family 4 protein, partial [Candidatus Woesearchaeota archaeon]
MNTLKKKNIIKARIAIVTNIPSPYRVTYFNELNKILGDNLLVLYCANNEPNRKWIVNNLDHNHLYLKKNTLDIFSKYIYFNKDIINKLKIFSPEYIITGGFYPTMLLSILYARIKKKKHFINTDAWYLTESNFRFYHKILRKLIYKSTDGFLPVSKKGKSNLITIYKIPEKKITIVPYVIDNKQYAKHITNEKKYHVVFSGQFIERKMPFFFIDVCKELNLRINDFSVLLLGDGPLLKPSLELLEKHKVKYYSAGFVQPIKIPIIMSYAKMLLFPTKKDGWGVVVNEACALGLPVITCDN